MKIGNLEVYGIIYKITNLKNNKVYIGQTTLGFEKRYSYTGNYDIERVYKHHKHNKDNDNNCNYHLLNAIEKYGFDIFLVEKIFDIAFSKDELDIKEQMWISIYDSFKNGYNRCEGGKGNKGCIHTDKWKEEHSSRMKGENNSFYGKHHTKETKEKLSLCFKGKTLSEERIQNISKGHLGIEPWNKGMEMSQEFKDKISEATKGIKNGNANIYKVIDLDENERIMCGNEIYNNGKIKGLLNINKKSFEKYILPYNEVNMDNIKPKTMNQHIRQMIENLKQFNGWKIFLYKI
ncbi:MAG: hypothetical protein IJZ36_04530 [Bacilli bacterium]|nr:hypothetical protein [Bacilli bacterium]